MEEESQVKRVAIGLVWREECLLVGVRPEGVPLAGYCEFPGGKCEPGEEPAAAVVREIAEETGLSVRVTRLRQCIEHDYPHGKLELSFFDCELDADTSTSPEPNAPFGWRPLQEVIELPFPPANVEILTSLRPARSDPKAQ